MSLLVTLVFCNDSISAAIGEQTIQHTIKCKKKPAHIDFLSMKCKHKMVHAIVTMKCLNIVGLQDWFVFQECE